MGTEPVRAEPRRPIRVLVADEQQPLREALVDLLATHEEIEVVGVASDLATAVEQARSERPDVALLGVRLAGGGGPQAAREIAKASPETGTIALSSNDDHASVVEMIQAGATGYLLMESPTSEIFEAILRAARGQASFPASLVAEIFAELPLEPDQRLRAFVEHAPDGIVVTDRTGRIVLVNAQTERLFGYGRDELIGLPLESLVPERLRGLHAVERNGFFAQPRTRPMGTGLELAGQRKDGSEFPVDVSLSGVDTGGARLVVAFVRDDTARRERVDHARELAARRAVLARVVAAGEEQRRQIAADIHDDSIQVMTAAGMRLQILRRSLESPEQLSRLDDLEETIRLSIARLRQLIFELRPPALDLDGLCAALRMYVEDAAVETGAVYAIDDRLTQEPPEEARLLLYRVAQEVLANVRKHARARRVHVVVSDRAGGYHVRVADDGVGFDPDGLDQRHGHLGLPAIRERVELAGGWLRVESAPGAGTVVEYWVGADLAEPRPDGAD